MMHDNVNGTTANGDSLDDIVSFLEGLPKAYPPLFAKPNTAAWLLRNRERNGLAAIVHFVGRQAFVSKRDFVAWFKSRPAVGTHTQAQRAASRANVAVARAVKGSRAHTGA